MKLRKAPIIIILLSCWGLAVFGQTDTTQMRSLIVHGGINPADYIVNQAAAHRDSNGAFSCSSFKYNFYHKTVVVPTRLSDSLKKLDSIYLFVSESVSEILYLSPSHKYEKLIASRTSGLDNPVFNLMLSRLQFPSIYESDELEIMGTRYVNPIAAGTTRRYSFELKDTLYDAGDTLYLISFKPRKSVTFNSLRGNLLISSRNFAVRRITAKPVDKNIFLKPNIVQDYQQTPDGHWFPERLTASIPFPQIAQAGDTLEAEFITTITVKNVEIGIPLKRSDFGLADVEECISSKEKNELTLNILRDSVLSEKEIRTYTLLDSVGRTLKLDRRMNMLPSLLRGYLPIGPIDIDIASIVNYSYTEGWRFGLGLYTNQRMARFVTLGGYFAYGLKDKRWKWGVSTDWELYRKRNLVLKIKYFDDITESGSTQLVSRDELGLLNGEFYRHWIISKFDRTKQLEAKLQMRADRNFTVSIAGGRAQKQCLYRYDFAPMSANNEDLSYTFSNTYIKCGVRFAYREKTLQTRDFTLYESSRFPTFQLQYERGFGQIGDFAYNKINARLHYLARYKRFGYSEIAITGGWIDRSLPYSLLCVMPAGYEQLGFYGREQFAAMRPSEFVTDSYVALFFRHNFGKMREGSFSPRIVLCQNIGWGWLRFANDHVGVQMSDMRKGYFETGIMIDNLLSAKDLLAMGVGVFYRYGAYSLEKILDNFAFKVSITVPLSE